MRATLLVIVVPAISCVGYATNRSASAPPSGACSYTPPTEVSQSYDRFRDRTLVELDRLGFGPPIPATAGICYYLTNLVIRAEFVGSSTTGSPAITWTLITLQSPGPDAPDFIVLLNGTTRVRLDVVGHEVRSEPPRTAHHITAALSPTILAAVAAASTVDIAVGAVEVRMTPDQIARVQDFANRLTF